MSILGSLLGGGSNRPEPSQTMQSNAGGLMSRFNPFNLASGMFGGRKAGAADNYAKTSGGMKKGLKKKDPKFVSKVSRGDIPAQKGESVTDIAAKLYGLVKRNDEKKRKELQIEENFAKSYNEVKEKRNKQLIAALTAQPKESKKETKEIKKESDQVKKETKEVKKEAPKEAPKGKEPVKEAPKPKEPVKEAPKPKEPVKEAPKPKEPVKEAPKPKEPTKAKRVEEKPSAAPAPAAPPPAPSAAPVAPVAALPSAAKVGVLVATGVTGLLASNLAQAGITQKGQANILAQVQAESKFKLQSENLNYKSAESIQKTFGKKRFPTIESAQPYVNNPEALANYAYKNTDGNSQPGDGWKYRGRGYIQHTGKNQYEAIKKYTGVDVVSNPDLLNTPEVASKALAWFFLEYKRLSTKDLEDINKVNKAVGFANKRNKSGKLESEERKEQAEKFSQLASTQPVGEKVEKASTENKDLKKQAAAGAPSIDINVNNNVVAANQQRQTMVQPKSDASRFTEGAKV